MDVKKKFIISIIHWLSEFPNSPVTPELTIDELANLNIFFKTLQILINDEEIAHLLDEFGLFDEICEVEITDGNYIVLEIFIKKAKTIKKVIESHLNFHFGKLKKVEGLRLIFKDICLPSAFIFKDLESICKCCELLLKMGIYSSRLSTFGLTSIEFLSATDKEAIDEYFDGDFRDIKVGNDILEQRLESLQEAYEAQLLILEAEKSNIRSDSSKFDQDRDTYTKIVEELKEKVFFQEQRCAELLTKTEDVTYVEEDYLESLVWENERYQEYLYSLLSN